MRLNCEVVVENWSCSTQGVRTGRKPARACLSVGRKPGSCLTENQNGRRDCRDTAFLLLCTTKNTNGTKYKICDNIANMYTKFLEKGKATIRFKEPPHDLCLRNANPTNLRKLLSTLKLSAKELRNVKLCTLAPVKASQINDYPRPDLMIYKRSDYPRTTSFPKWLKKLGVVSCGMLQIDVRILNLKELVSLNLSGNRIKELNVSLDRLKLLKALELSSNMIRRLPSRLCRSNLANTLTYLDLTNNNLSSLPISLGYMHSLVNLKLDDNKLHTLPWSIGNLNNLRALSVAGNQLGTLPSSIENLDLESLDISENPFIETEWYCVETQCDIVPSLQECAARVIKESRIYYHPISIGRYLCDYLDSAKACGNCHKACFDRIAYQLMTMDLHSVAFTVVTTHDLDRIPIEVCFCSRGCFSKRHEI